MRITIIILPLLLITLSMNISAREVQKWTDADGQVHYGDYSDNTNSKSVKVPDASPRSQRPVPNNSLKTRAKLLDAMNDERKQKKEKTAMEKSNREIAKKNCTIAKSQVHSLQAGGRKVRFDEKGERTYLDDKQISSELTQAKKLVSKHCK